MSNSRVIIEIKQSDPAFATVQDILSDDPSRPRNFMHKVINFCRALLAGARSASIDLRVCDGAAVAASKVGTFAGTPAASETVSINGIDITFVDGAAGNNQVQRDDAPTVSVLASRLASAINNSTSEALSGVVHASASSGAVTVSCNVAGVIGNSISLADAAANFSWAGGATALSGGSGSIVSPESFSFGL